MAALLPILLALALLAPGLLYLTSGSAWPGLGWSLLLAPILYRAGSRLRPPGDREVQGAVALPALGQAVLGTFLLGGTAHLLIPRELTGLGGALSSALLWGAVLATGEPVPSAAGGAARSGPVAKLAALLEGQAALVLLLVLVLLPLLLRGPASGSLELALGFAIGAGTGLGGVLASRVRLPPLVQALLSFLLAEAASLGAAAVHGSPSIAAFTCGVLQGPTGSRWTLPLGGPRGEGAAGGHSRLSDPPAGSRREEVSRALDWIALVAAVGLLFRAGEAFDFGSPAYLSGGVLLWGAAVALRFLVETGFGGLYRWRNPRELPLRWLSALAWGSHSGPAAAGLLFLWMEQTESRGVPLPLSAPLWAIALALLIQGGTSAAVLVRAATGPVPGRVRDRWGRLKALSIALRAERRAIDDLARQGTLDEEALASMEEAVAGGQRRIEAALSEIHGADPALRSDELSAAVRAVLAAGREAVAEARERGWIGEAAAGEVERELAERWSRSGDASLHDLLGAGPENPPPGGAKPGGAPPHSASRGGASRGGAPAGGPGPAG